MRERLRNRVIRGLERMLEDLNTDNETYGHYTVVYWRILTDRPLRGADLEILTEALKQWHFYCSKL